MKPTIRLRLLEQEPKSGCFYEFSGGVSSIRKPPSRCNKNPPIWTVLQSAFTLIVFIPDFMQSDNDVPFTACRLEIVVLLHIPDIHY